MKYFNGTQILYSLVLFSVFGMLVGALYFLCFVDRNQIKKIAFCWLYVLKSKSFSPTEKLNYAKGFGFYSKIVGYLYEFVFFSLSGVIYILLLYVGCDGVFRLYTLIIFSVFGCLSYKLTNAVLGKTVSYLFDKCFIALYALLFVISYPLRYLLNTVNRITAMITNKIKSKSKMRAYRRIINEKSKEQAMILKNMY